MGNSHHKSGPAEVKASHHKSGPAEVKMSADEIVKLLPRLSPGLSHTLVDHLPLLRDEGIVEVGATSTMEAVLKEVREGFTAELKALLGSVQEEEGSDGDVLLEQLSLCLLVALAPSLPNASHIHIHGFGFDPNEDFWTTYGGEQAVAVLYSALVSQHWSSAVRVLSVLHVKTFGSDRGCEHLAHLLKSGHCKLQKLEMRQTGMGAGGMGHIARALHTNRSLTELEIIRIEVGDGGVEQLATMLRTNSTLQDLTLREVGMTEHGLRHLCDAMSTQQSLQATSSSASGTLGPGLKALTISENKIGGGGAALLGAMLANNRCLRSLNASSCSLVEDDINGEGQLAKGLQSNSTLEELHIANNPQLGKVAVGLLVRCIATNNTTLKTLKMGGAEMPMPAAAELAHMIATNHSLVTLGLQQASYSAKEWATVILPALGRNRTLQSIDLSHCMGVGGEQVRAALLDLLRINTTIGEIYLDWTPLHRSGEAGAVERELGRNKEFRHALSALPTAKPKSCRIVLCGHAYAGKTSLLQTMKLLQQDVQPSSSIDTCEDPLSFGRSSHNNNEVDLEDKELSTRTRGIDIHLFKDEPGLRISVWDLAGHREFHALHDFMFPSGNNAATVFVLTVSPIVSPADELRAGKVKTMQELEVELQYWLRFMASNSKPSAALPTAVVVITHKDTLLRLGVHVESWMRSAQDVIDHLAAKFSGRVQVQSQSFMVNALASQDVELNRWVSEVEKSLRSTLDGLQEEPAICTQVLEALHDFSQTSSNSPIISRAEFGNICRSLVPHMSALSQGEAGDPTQSTTSIAISGDPTQSTTSIAISERVCTAIAAYLHDAGEVIHHEKLGIIVSNPRWFCQGVLGQLIDLFPSSHGLRVERPKNGLLSRAHLSSLLQEAVKSVPGLDPAVVTLDQLIQLMLLLDLCYEQTPGDPNTAYFLPAIFHDEGNKAADGKQPLTWRELNLPFSTFVGRRLQCGDMMRTFLTDGFFPRLQVVLHNHAVNKKWIVGRYSGTYLLAKNLFSIWVNGLEILIEFAGSSGYFVDILVKSSKSHQQTMEFLHPNIISTIRTFCASQEGCQGVTLVEAIIRPECLYAGAGGNPILCTYRREQYILVEELTQKMKLMPDYEHCWDKVEDGAGGLVLRERTDLGKVLLEGTKHVAPGPEVTEDCYPDSNVKEGKERGLLILISMEGYESGYRLGGSVDRGRLEALAGNLGLEVEGNLYLDFSAADLCRAMEDASRTSILAEHECVVCFISAHGGTHDGAQFFTDPKGAMVSLLDDIVEPFRKCENLLGKPKIFFINTCRGTVKLRSAPGSGVEQPVRHWREGLLFRKCENLFIFFINACRGTVKLGSTHGSSVEQPVPHWREGQEVRYVGQHSDCLLVFSTSEQAVSMRDEEYGTNFVYALMQAFNSKRRTKDVVSIITGVTHEVADVEVEDDTSGELQMYSQCPTLVSSLRKPLYWRNDKV